MSPQITSPSPELSVITTDDADAPDVRIQQRLSQLRLDPEQSAAATSDASALRILAGAGTGKTTTLTARVAHLIATGVPAERILLLTFTRRAAAEMMSRVQSLVGHTQAGPRARIRGGTFHSMAHRTLRRHSQQLGLPGNFNVLDPSDAADLMEVVRTETLTDTQLRKRFPRRSTLWDIYSRTVNTQQPLQHVLTDSFPWCLPHRELIGQLCASYTKRKAQMAVLDFDDLLLHWQAGLASEFGDSLRAEFDQVLVDEYQDVNSLQVNIVQGLTASGAGLCVVGDDAQAIYSFRGSSPRHILNVADDFPGIVNLQLATNYRSVGSIVDVANAVACEATEGFDVQLRPAPQRSQGDSPTFTRCYDEADEANLVCDRVLELHESGIDLRDQAVLVRASQHSDRLELELGQRRIPFIKYGGLTYLQAAHIKDLLALFRIVDNPRDELSWLRWLRLLDRVGPATARSVVSALEVNDGSPGEVLQRASSVVDLLPTAARPDAFAVMTALVRLPDESLTDHAQRLRAALSTPLTNNYDNAEERLTDLQTLIDMTTSVNTLSDVAAEHAMDPPVRTSELAGPPLLDEDWLTISTVHAAKGLEWTSVHVLRAVDGSFPSDMALTDRDGLEEERRLFYVAATRAKKHLTFTAPSRLHGHSEASNSRNVWGQPSRFLTGAVASAIETTATHSHSEPPVAASGPVVDTTSAVTAKLASLW